MSKKVKDKSFGVWKQKGKRKNVTLELESEFQGRENAAAKLGAES